MFATTRKNSSRFFGKKLARKSRGEHTPCIERRTYWRKESIPEHRVLRRHHRIAIVLALFPAARHGKAS